MITLKEIERQLTTDFSPEKLTIDDDSHLHSGHFEVDGGVSHITVNILSEKFLEKSRVHVHRLIYRSLDPFIKRGLHAIKIVVMQ